MKTGGRGKHNEVAASSHFAGTDISLYTSLLKLKVVKPKIFKLLKPTFLLRIKNDAAQIARTKTFLVQRGFFGWRVDLHPSPLQR